VSWVDGWGILSWQQVAEFNGSSSYILADNTLSSGNYTQAVWVYLNNKNKSQEIVITNGNNYNMQFYIAPNNKVRINYWIWSASYIESNTALELGQWYHLAVSRNGTTAKVYINGNLDNTWTVTSSFRQENWSIWAQKFYNQLWFDGKMSRLKLYDSALSDSEINDLYMEEIQSPVPTPTNLSQSFIAPETTEAQPIDIWQSIWKFQSGDWVVFWAQIMSDTPEDYELQIEVLDRNAGFNIVDTKTINYGSWWTASLVFQLPAWSYNWRAKTIDWTNESDVTVAEIDGDNGSFSIFEGTEPYPFGFSISNRWPKTDLLTGGISFRNTSLPKVDLGTKWEIFNKVYPEWVFQSQNQMIRAFEVSQLNEDNPTILTGGSCYGLALISATYSLDSSNPYGWKIQEDYNNLYEEISRNIYSSIEITEGNEEIDGDIYPKWIQFDDMVSDIYAAQLSQMRAPYFELRKESLDNLWPQDILNIIKNNPSKRYQLQFAWAPSDEQLDESWAHNVIPYRVEWNRIYFTDSNIPYPNIEQNDIDYSWYGQYIEIQSNEIDGFSLDKDSPYILNSGWNYLYSLSIVDIEDIYSQERPMPLWFWWEDALYTFKGTSSITISDSEWRVTGFSGTQILESIPWAIAIIPSRVTLDWENLDNTWKQIYIPENIENYTIQIESNTDENYDFMIAWGDYYTKLEWVSTSSWQIDILTSTATNLEIDFDDSKIWDYNLLVDNFQNSGTGTIYVDAVEITPELQSFTVDWDKVVQDAPDAVVYETDSDGDGTLDTTISVPAITTWEELIEEEFHSLQAENETLRWTLQVMKDNLTESSEAEQIFKWMSHQEENHIQLTFISENIP